MKALRNKILVKSYANQKEAIQIKGEGGKVIELWVGKKFATNHREKNPVICTVVDNASKYDYIKEGDTLLVHHNLLSDWKTNPYCIEYDVETGEGLYSFHADKSVFCKLNEDGSVLPVCGNIVAERIANPIKSILHIPDTVKQEYKDRVKVLSVSPEVEGIYPDQVVQILQYADYEICYTWDKKDYSAIKVFSEEIIGIVN